MTRVDAVKPVGTVGPAVPVKFNAPPLAAEFPEMVLFSISSAPPVTMLIAPPTPLAELPLRVLLRNARKADAEDAIAPPSDVVEVPEMTTSSKVSCTRFAVLKIAPPAL